MKILILFFALTISIYSQEFGIKSNLDKPYRIVEQTIEKCINLDSLIKYFSDSSITSRIAPIRASNDMEHVVHSSKRLFKHVQDNDFMNGYKFEKFICFVNFKKLDVYGVRDRSFEIRIRSKKSKAIIWFFFDDREDGVWKLMDFAFCNNYADRVYPYNPPCDTGEKDQDELRDEKMNQKK